MSYLVALISVDLTSVIADALGKNPALLGGGRAGRGRGWDRMRTIDEP